MTSADRAMRAMGLGGAARMVPRLHMGLALMMLRLHRRVPLRGLVVRGSGLGGARRAGEGKRCGQREGSEQEAERPEHAVNS